MNALLQLITLPAHHHAFHASLGDKFAVHIGDRLLLSCQPAYETTGLHLEIPNLSKCSLRHEQQSLVLNSNHCQYLQILFQDLAVAKHSSALNNFLLTYGLNLFNTLL